MKISLASVCLISLLGLSAFAQSTTFSSKPDLVTTQQRYPFKLASANSSKQQPWATVFFYPAKSQSGNEIRLPLGVNQTTVQLSSGDRVLQVDEDYVFIPNANLIRVLDEEALTVQQPIRITYEGITSTDNKRLNLGYKP